MLPTPVTSQEHCSVSHLHGLTVHIKREEVLPCDFFLFHKMQPAKYSLGIYLKEITSVAKMASFKIEQKPFKLNVSFGGCFWFGFFCLFGFGFGGFFL